MLVEELIDILSKMPPKTEVVANVWVSWWSGNPEDSDLSCYENRKIQSVELKEQFVEWERNDPRRKDKRRTIHSDKVPVVEIKAEI